MQKSLYSLQSRVLHNFFATQIGVQNMTYFDCRDGSQFEFGIQNMRFVLDPEILIVHRIVSSDENCMGITNDDTSILISTRLNEFVQNELDAMSSKSA